MNSMRRRLMVLLAVILLFFQLISVIWLWHDTRDVERIASHVGATFWYVLPSLPMFLAFPWLLPRIGFWPTLAASAAITAVCFGLFAWATRPFGIQLLP